jgi:Zn-dependent protease with chaperone function
MNEIRPLKGLQAEHFMHPGDRVGIERIKTYAVFKKFMEKLLVEGLEDDMYLMSLADNVKLGPNQGKKLYDMLLNASNILDMKAPMLFMDTDPVPNAYAYGQNKPIVVLTSGLVDAFSDEEIFAIISHELGHIKCRHTLYTIMALNIDKLMHILSALPLLGPTLGVGFFLSLMSWFRRSELSADRAALLTTQSKDLIAKTMMKLAGGGSNKLCESLSLESFLEQAAEYEGLQKERLNSGAYKKWAYIFGTLMTTGRSTHPWPAVRTMEAIKFYNSDRYKRIVLKDYPQEKENAEGMFAKEDVAKDEELDMLKQGLKDAGDGAVKYGKKVRDRVVDKLQRIVKDIGR